MPIHGSLAHHKAEGDRITIHCQTQPPRGENPCRHSAEVDWDTLISRFGPDFDIVANRAYFLSRFVCKKCHGKDFTITFSPPSWSIAGKGREG